MSDLDEFDCEFDAVDELALLQALDHVENKISTTGLSTVSTGLSLNVFSRLELRPPTDQLDFLQSRGIRRSSEVSES